MWFLVFYVCCSVNRCFVHAKWNRLRMADRILWPHLFSNTKPRNNFGCALLLVNNFVCNLYVIRIGNSKADVAPGFSFVKATLENVANRWDILYYNYSLQMKQNLLKFLICLSSHFICVIDFRIETIAPDGLHLM